MNKYHAIYNYITTKKNILLTEQNIHNELKIRLIVDGYNPSDEELNDITKGCIELYEEAKWWQHGLAHIGGAIDPTGIIDIGHSIYYFVHGQIVSGILTLIGVIPYLGDGAKLLIPFTKAGRALKMVPGGPALSFTKMALNKMPLIQKGLTKIVAKMIKSPHMKQILIKTFGAPTSMATKYATTGGKVLIRPGAPHIANQIINHIVNKMIGPLDKFLRMLAGPRIGSGIGKIAAGQMSKGALYNLDFSGIPSLKKYSTASTRSSDKMDRDLAAAREILNKRLQQRQTIFDMPPSDSQSAPSIPLTKKSYNYKLGN